MTECSRCGENEQLPTGTLCMECVRDDLDEYDEKTASEVNTER